MNRPITRRAALLGAGAGLILATGMTRAARAAFPALWDTSDPSLRAGYDFLDLAMDAYPDSGMLRLPQSYSDEIGLYTTAYTSDAALALLAYLVDDRAESAERARLLGESLRFAQDHDPRFTDGRLRQSYTIGPYLHGLVEQPDGFVRPDGTVNAGNAFRHLGSDTADQAWAGLALSALFRRTRNPDTLTAATRLGRWVVDTCGTDQPLGGYRAGVDRDARPLTTTGTADNAALVALFGQLAELTGDQVWTARQQRAATFVAAMWRPAGCFAPGSADGRTVAQSPPTTEAQTAAFLASRGSGVPPGAVASGAGLDWAASRLTVVDTAGRRNSAVPDGMTVTGVTFSDRSRLADPNVPIEPGLGRPDSHPDLDAVWLAGTAQLGAGLLARSAPGDAERAHALLTTLAAAQHRLGPGQTLAGRELPVGAGVVAASSPLHTGVDAGAGIGGYFPVRHVGTTAWYLLTATGTNPYAPLPAA